MFRVCVEFYKNGGLKKVEINVDFKSMLEVANILGVNTADIKKLTWK